MIPRSHLKGKSSRVDQSRLQKPSTRSRSQIWNFFVQNGDDKTSAMCRSCHRVIPRYGTSTSTLIKHLRQNHFELNQEFYRLTFGQTKTDVGVDDQHGSTSSVAKPEPITLAIEDPERSPSSSPELCTNPTKQQTPTAIGEPADIPNKRSKIWCFFAPSSRSLYYHCNECGIELKRYGTSTSDFISHLRVCHVDLYRQFRQLSLLAKRCRVKQALDKRVAPRSRGRPRKFQDTEIVIPKIGQTTSSEYRDVEFEEPSRSKCTTASIPPNSHIWNFFVPCTDDSLKLRCIECNEIVTMQRGSTRNCVSHLRLNHVESHRQFCMMLKQTAKDQLEEVRKLRFQSGITRGRPPKRLQTGPKKAAGAATVKFADDQPPSTSGTTQPNHNKQLNWNTSSHELGQSQIFKYFIASSDHPFKYRCIECDTIVMKQFGGTTSCFIDHLQSFHVELYRQFQRLSKPNPQMARAGVQRGHHGGSVGSRKIRRQLVDVEPRIASPSKSSRKMSPKMSEAITAVLRGQQSVEMASMKFGVSLGTLNLQLSSRSSLLAESADVEVEPPVLAPASEEASTSTSVSGTERPLNKQRVPDCSLERVKAILAENAGPIGSVSLNEDSVDAVVLSPCAPPPGNVGSVDDLICVEECPDEPGSCDVTFEELVSDEVSDYLQGHDVRKLCNYFSELIEVDIKITTELGLSIVGSVLLEKGLDQSQIDSMLTNEWWQLFCFENSIVYF